MKSLDLAEKDRFRDFFVARFHFSNKKTAAIMPCIRARTPGSGAEWQLLSDCK